MAQHKNAQHDLYSNKHAVSIVQDSIWQNPKHFVPIMGKRKNFSKKIRVFF